MNNNSEFSQVVQLFNSKDMLKVLDHCQGHDLSADDFCYHLHPDATWSTSIFDGSMCPGIKAEANNYYVGKVLQTEQMDDDHTKFLHTADVQVISQLN